MKLKLNIEKSIPLPPIGGYKVNPIKMELKSMEIGDSIGGLKRKEAHYLTMTARKIGMKMASRKMDGEHIRLWYVKKLDSNE
jgi:hypothetical protein